MESTGEVTVRGRAQHTDAVQFMCQALWAVPTPCRDSEGHRTTHTDVLKVTCWVNWRGQALVSDMHPWIYTPRTSPDPIALTPGAVPLCHLPCGTGFSQGQAHHGHLGTLRPPCLALPRPFLIITKTGTGFLPCLFKTRLALHAGLVNNQHLLRDLLVFSRPVFPAYILLL